MVIGSKTGPVGDITGGYKPPRRGRFILREVANIEAHEVMEDGDLWRIHDKGAQSPEAG